MHLIWVKGMDSTDRLSCQEVACGSPPDWEMGAHLRGNGENHGSDGEGVMIP